MGGSDDGDPAGGYWFRARDPAMVGVALSWAAGLGGFCAAYAVASTLPTYARLDPSVAVVRRLARGVKGAAALLVLLALPLVYVAAAKRNPVATQDATVVWRGLSWNWWLPRPVSQIFLHAFLGPHAKTHPALRLAYALALAGSVPRAKRRSAGLRYLLGGSPPSRASEPPALRSARSPLCVEDLEASGI